MADVSSARVHPLNEKRTSDSGRYVLYWMQQSQRSTHNPALEYALRRANQQGRPLLIVFGLTDDYPDANLRHYRFMLEGLRETKEALAERGLHLVVKRGRPDLVALSAAEEATLIVTDRGYLRHQKHWRQRVANEASCRVVQIEGDVVVPVETASSKAEYAARTLRPKIHQHLDRFLRLPEAPPVAKPSRDLDLEGGLELDDIDALLDQLNLDRSVPPVTNLYRGGRSEAVRSLKDFLDTGLEGYDELRNQPETSAVSHMSKYLHFGQISPVWLAQTIMEAEAPLSDVESYMEELVVRRELAINHVHFRPAQYDTYACLPEWARETLAEHASDVRDPEYSKEELEAGATHDPYWNAAMAELRETGYMHNYMRMYWGKKILEWSPTPKTAYAWTLELNNRYFLDGRDPNSFANVAWVFGLHDRGWKERPIYGKVRYMSKGGLERKADPEAYVQKVQSLIRTVTSTGARQDRQSN